MDYPLSPAQMGIWFDVQLNGDGGTQNIAGLAELSGPIDVEHVQRAVADTVTTTSAHGLRLRLLDGLPRQYLEWPSGYTLEVVDLSAGACPEDDAYAWMERRGEVEFKIYDGSLFEFALLKLADERHYLFSKYHHLAMDGVSGVEVLSRIARRYSLLQAGQAAEPATDWPDYLARLEAEIALASSAQTSAARGYWRGQLADLSADAFRARLPITPRSHSRRAVADLGAETDRALRGTAQACGTPFLVYLMALAASHLRRLSRLDAVVIWTPVQLTAARGARVATVGVNVLPLVAPAIASTADLAKLLNRQLRGLLRHRRYGGLKRDLRASLGFTPGTPLVLNAMPFFGDLAFGQAHGRPESLKVGPVEGLHIAIEELGPSRGCQMRIFGNADVFAQSDVDAILRDLVASLRQVDDRASPDASAHASSRRNVLENVDPRESEVKM